VEWAAAISQSAAQHSKGQDIEDALRAKGFHTNLAVLRVFARGLVW
jgi:hypothetical protein